MMEKNTTEYQNITKATMAELEEIKNMQKQIMALLDRIEEQRAAKEPVRTATQVHKLEAGHTGGVDMAKPSHVDVDTRTAKTETVVKPLQDTGARPKMMSKASTEGSGHKEHFELSEEHKKYGKSLRRRCVALHQDNRLSEKFGYSPVEGYVGTQTHLADEHQSDIDRERNDTQPVPAQQIEVLKNTANQKEEETSSDNKSKPDGEKQATSNAFTQSSTSTKAKHTASSGSVSPASPESGVTSSHGKELSQTKHQNIDTIPKSGSTASVAGQSKPDSAVDNKSAATQSVKNSESKREGSPMAMKRSSESQVGNESLEQHDENQDALAAKSSSDDEVPSDDDGESENADPGKSALGIWSNIVVKAAASGEVALTKEAMTKMVKESQSQMGLPDIGVIDQLVDAYFEATKTPDGDIDPTKLLSPESMSKFMKDVMARAGICESPLVDQLTSGFCNAAFPEGKYDLRRVAQISEQNAKGLLGFEVPGLDGVEDEPKTGDTEVERSAAVKETESNGARFKDDSSEYKKDDNPAEEIDINSWQQFAEKEKSDGARAIRAEGMDTLFLLDVSGSMKGSAWKQATEFIKNFLDCLQARSSLQDKAFEHVALVTFGGETRVQQHLTCDYVQIQRQLESLKPSGPSPLLGGVIMLEAAVLGASHTFVVNNYKIPPRVFLITDGKPTLSSLMGGADSDKSTISPEEREALLTYVLRIHSLKIRIYPVPVGCADKSLLQEIASLTEGSIVSSEDWKTQAAAFKNYQLAATLGVEGLNPLLTGPMSETDLQQCRDFLRTHEQKRERKEIKGLPPLGSRVELETSGDSCGRIGTVTKHMENGHFGVTWDYPDDEGDIRRSEVSAQQVKQVNKPRVLFDELIAPGCRVRRGPDWRYADQDGGAGNVGSVYKVNSSGIVKVRWDNGHTNSYRFAAEGKFDLDIVEGEAAAHGTRAFKNTRVNKNRTIASKNSDTKEERPSPAPKPASTPIPTPAPARTLTDEERVAEMNRRNQPSVTALRKWFWQSGNEWKPFADDVNAVVEEKYQSNPNGTVIVSIDNESYRVVLPKLYMTHINTKIKHTIERR